MDVLLELAFSSLVEAGYSPSADTPFVPFAKAALAQWPKGEKLSDNNHSSF